MAATDTSVAHNKILAERVAWLEGQMGHMATKAWVLGGVLGGMGIAATIAVAIVRLLWTQ